MADIRREVGFWSSLRAMGIVSILWPEGIWAVVIGGGGATLFGQYSSIQDRVDVASDYLAIVAPLLGITVAALALVITVTITRYGSILSETERGIVGFTSPFVVAIGAQAVTLLMAIAYRALALELGGRVECLFFLIVSILSVFVLLDVVALARNLVMHGRAIARYAQDDS
ncbi:MAG: hypothetical protein OXG76_12950 [Acidimicrobiaceae bacterium]|nr:hypothetical protein [Acidimicrobiaceae bacterium]